MLEPGISKENTNTCELQGWHILWHSVLVVVSRTSVGAMEYYHRGEKSAFNSLRHAARNTRLPRNCS